jgi:hypothetical protein
MIAVAVEPIASGLFVVVSRSLFSHLVWGAELSAVGQVLGHLGGIVLLALGISCRPARTLPNVSAPAVRAMLAYNLLAAGYLAYIGVASNLVGVLLWPAVVIHAILGVLVIRAWVAISKK